jgi:putative acetyltransferase
VSFHVRPYRAEDRAAMAEVYFRAVREGAKGAYTEAQLEAWAPQVEPNWDKPDKLLDQWAWVAIDEQGRMRGIMSLDSSGYLDMVFVTPEAKGTKVAPSLYAALLAQARMAGLARLTVRASILARRFFLKQGWQVDQMHMHEAAGQIYETYLMSLTLGGAPD